MPPLLLAIGLAFRLLPRKQQTERLASSFVAGGVVMLVQAVSLEVYVGWTMRSHNLPWPLPDGLAAIMGWLGADAVADGSAIVVHSLRQVHRLAATWELLFDPATWLFFAGGLATIAFCKGTRDRGLGISRAKRSAFQSLASNPQSLIPYVAFALVVLAWLPIRAGLMMALYFHRVLISDPSQPLHAMNHFFSPWMLLALLTAPMLLAWRFVRPRNAGSPALTPGLNR